MSLFAATLQQVTAKFDKDEEIKLKLSIASITSSVKTSDDPLFPALDFEQQIKIILSEGKQLSLPDMLRVIGVECTDNIRATFYFRLKTLLRRKVIEIANPEAAPYSCINHKKYQLVVL